MPPTFPGAPPNALGLKAEILVNGVWQDISAYVYHRNSVQITNMGRPDWTSTLQAAQLTLTLNNRDGRFSPKNTAGAYYPNLTRNVQLRVSVNSQSVTGTAYNGYRFWGEVSAWPPAWNPNATDVYCDITAAGIWRRMTQLQTTLGSAYRRYVTRLASAPQAYWPMEDGTGSTRLIPFIPLAGTNYGTFTVLGTNAPSLAASSAFSGSDAIVQLNATKITLPVPAGGTATNNVTRFLMSVPAAGDSASGSTSWNLIEIDSAGTVAKFELYLNPAGTLTFNLRNSGGTIIASGTTTTNVKGQPYLVSCELTPSGANVSFAVRLIKPGAAAITESLTGTLTTASVGAVSQVLLGRANQLNDTAVGHTAVYYSAPQSMVAEAYALNGYIGETVLDRFSRLCNEMGIDFKLISNNPNSDFAGGSTTGWTAANGTLSTTSSPPAGSPLQWAALFTVTTAGQSPPASLNQVSVPFSAVAGATYEAGAWVWTATGTAVIGFDWQNSSNVYLSTSTVSVTVPASTWTWVTTLPLTAPASTAFAYMRVAPADGSGNAIYVELAVAGPTSAALGPQVDDTLSNLMQSIEDTEVGLLYEARDLFGLGLRLNASMANQAAAVVLSYTSAVLDPALVPAYDDQLTRNNITVTNYTGYTQQAILTTGAMSILNPPSGIGNGYAYQRNVSAASDTQLAGIATFLLNQGAVDEVRFPVMTFKMVRASLASFYASLPGLRPGDYLQVTSMPSFLTSSTVKQLVWGWSEVLNPTTPEWTIAFNTVPESVWETGFSPGTVQTAQIPGGSAVVSSAPGTSLAPIIQNGSITPAMLNQGITIHTLGGTAVTIASSAPSSPNINDIWINSGTGLISQWNGTSWVAITFNAQNTIQAGTIVSSLIAAGTIVASNIAAGTITAALLAAGIVVAGIVDATTITGAKIVADGTSGDILVYSGTPATGNLIFSISGAAGSDSFSNNFAQGAEVKSGGLILDNQSSAPAAVSGASLFYSSTAGRPRYLSQSGNDSVLERSVINVAQFAIGNVTSANIISAPTTYQVNEGNQSSEYEIQIIGTLNWGTTVLSGPIFQLFLDGAAIGGGTATQFTVGVTGITAADVSGYRVSFGISILTTGVSGTVLAWSAGTMWNQSHNRIGANGANLGAVSNNVTFDTTSSHTLQVYGWFSSSQTGQAMTTYRTRLIRRM